MIGEEGLVVVVDKYLGEFGVEIWMFLGEVGVEVILYCKWGVLGIVDEILIGVSLYNCCVCDLFGVEVLVFVFVFRMFWNGLGIVDIFWEIDVVFFCIMEL